MSNPLNAPWSFDEDGIIIDTTGNPIMRGDMTEEEFSAKGNLIAAAPDLLDACKLATHIVDSGAYPDVYEILSKAVAKAEGESSE